MNNPRVHFRDNQITVSCERNFAVTSVKVHVDNSESLKHWEKFGHVIYKLSNSNLDDKVT